MPTVKWFAIPSLTAVEIAERLGVNVARDRESAAAVLPLFLDENGAPVACQTSGMIKVFYSAPRVIAAAEEAFGPPEGES